MNRILKRPMFRMGGSTGTGITSGLDAPRQKYSDAGRVQRALETTKEAEAALNKFNQQRGAFAPTGLSGFLTSFGLDLMSRSPQGGFLSTAAQAAKDPFKTFQAAQLQDQQRRANRAEDIFSSALASEYSLEEQLLKNKGEGGSDPFKFEKELTILEKRIREKNTLVEENARLQEEITSLQSSLGNPNANTAQINEQIKQKQEAIENNIAEIEINDSLINQIKGDDPYKLAEAQFIIEEFGADSPEYEEFKKTGKLPRKEKAEGGRAAYSMGGSSMMPAVAEAEENQVEDLSYNELRSRLPQSISNDVVQVIANSKQALLDFANIRDQQDVDQFNQRYNVNLNIAQEG